MRGWLKLFARKSWQCWPVVLVLVLLHPRYTHTALTGPPYPSLSFYRFGQTFRGEEGEATSIEHLDQCDVKPSHFTPLERGESRSYSEGFGYRKQRNSDGGNEGLRGGRIGRERGWVGAGREGDRGERVEEEVLGEGEGDTKAMFPSSIESTDEHTPLLRPPERRSERPRYECKNYLYLIQTQQFHVFIWCPLERTKTARDLLGTSLFRIGPSASPQTIFFSSLTGMTPFLRNKCRNLYQLSWVFGKLMLTTHCGQFSPHLQIVWSFQTTSQSYSWIQSINSALITAK